jgi:2-keto-3-deoxy-L-rhamnonate aldolase RhmA
VTPTSLRAQLADRPIIGTFAGINAPAAVEALGWAGFDAICIDAEHGALGIADIENLIRAADVTATPALVRVPELGPAVGRVLDAGAAGVLVPRVETGEQAAEAVRRVRYPPLGARGAGPGRSTRYGVSIGDYLAHANDDVLLAVQVETADGVHSVADIAGTPGVDVVFVGPGDLSVSLGTEPGSPSHAAAIDEILDAAGQAGTATGIFAGEPAAIERYAALGVRLFLLAADVVFLAQGAAAAVGDARARMRGSSVTAG